MNFSTAAVTIAAVVACNGCDPRTAPAKAGSIATHDAAPVVMPAPSTAVMDAHPVGPGGLDTATASGGASTAGDDDLPLAPEVEAFHGHLPALPLLSPDGEVAAIDVSEGLGLSSFHTYEVAFLAEGSRARERIVVVDRALAKALADAGPVGGRAMKLPTRRLASAAAKITQRLAGFTPFAREFDHDAIARAGGSLSLDGAELQFHSDETAGLDLRLIGVDIRTEHHERVAVRPPQYTDREGGRCGGQPRLAGVWRDRPRRRVLLLVIFPGRDSCEDESPLWLVW
jgi:hypothetical protein